MASFPRETGITAAGHAPARVVMRVLALGAALAVSGCNNIQWDLRTNASSTADAPAAAARPTPDANGVISYPGYQVAVARQGDTVATVAKRLGIDARQLAANNALRTTDPLREGEVLALPTRVASTGAPAGGVDVASLAASAIDSATTNGSAANAASAGSSGAAVPFQTAQPGPEPLRHQVKRGETAFSIARLYNVSPKDLADWNGLGPDFAVREGQYLLIPTKVPNSPAPASAGSTTAAAGGLAIAGAAAVTSTTTATPPGKDSPTPLPPSASQPLPTAQTKTPAQVAKSLPPSPDLGSQRTAASASKFVMPVAGSIIRPYQKGKNEGIDITAAAGSPVKAADAGTVAKIIADTHGTPIVVLRHADNILTVYAGIDKLTVAEGDKVSRGQVIGEVKAGNPAFLHFEVRQGIESVDPMSYLQ